LPTSATHWTRPGCQVEHQKEYSTLQTECFVVSGGPLDCRANKLLMIIDFALGKMSALTRFDRTKTAAISTIVGMCVSLSAIASVNTLIVPQAETEITQQILLIEDQEDSSRSAQRMSDLLAPRTGLSFQRSAFPMVSNPVLVAEMRQIERAKLAPEHLTLQKAVAEVVMNRVDSSRYPDTVCEVVNQGANKRHRCQFSYNCDGIPETINEMRAWKRAQGIAKEMVSADDRPLTHGATHYHTTAVRPFWSKSLVRTAKYGAHIFYKRGTRLSRR